MKFYIEQDHIKALLLTAEKEGAMRYMLSAICFDVRLNDAVAVTTDGHRMTVMRLTPEADETREVKYVPGRYVVNRGLFDIGQKTLKILPFCIELKGKEATVSVADRCIKGEAGDYYADWRKVVPRSLSNEAGAYNTDYVADFTKAHRLLGGGKGTFPVFRQNGKTGAARVDLGGGAIGVLMPIATDYAPIHNPDWILA